MGRQANGGQGKLTTSGSGAGSGADAAVQPSDGAELLVLDPLFHSLSWYETSRNAGQSGRPAVPLLACGRAQCRGGDAESGAECAGFSVREGSGNAARRNRAGGTRQTSAPPAGRVVAPGSDDHYPAACDALPPNGS